MTDDIRFMKRAIELGWRGIGRVSPNPLVGCVIVRDGEIVGEGFHLYDKIEHAETIALGDAGEKARGATACVSVEPCCHTGRTPPCTDALVQAGIKRVVYGMKDPDPRVNGGGETALLEAGIYVTGHVLEDQVRRQNRFFITAKENNRPYVLLKWAMTIDGKIATRIGASRWISNDESRNVVHHLRNIYDCVLAGHSTVLTDNPMLTCRVDINKTLPAEIFPAVPPDVRNPARLIVDVLGATCCTPDLKIFHQPGKTMVAIAHESVWDDTRSRDHIDKDLIDLIECPLKIGHIDLDYLLKKLVELGIHSVLVEGGSGINAAFLEAGLVDEAAIFIAPKIFGGEMATCPISGSGVENVDQAWTLENVINLRFIDDLLVMGKISRADLLNINSKEGED